MDQIINKSFRTEKEIKEMHPAELRRALAAGEIGPLAMGTAGLCPGFVQANLVLFDREYESEFEDFAQQNEKVFPILEKLENTPYTSVVANHANILTDLPLYNIWIDGRLTRQTPDATEYWQDGMVAYLIGSSLSFDSDLIDAGIGMRHISLGCQIPIYMTNIETKPSMKGTFHGPLFVSMRPVYARKLALLSEITAKFPRMHGEPLQIGSPEKIGIGDIMSPAIGEAIYITEGEIPVFWPSGISVQAAIAFSKIPFAITQAASNMLVTDLMNETLSL